MRAAHDLKSAYRNLAKSPGFAITCILVLAVGLAVNTAAFSVVNTLLRRPLPFANPERIANLYERNVEKGFSAGVSYPAFAEWRERCRGCDQIGAAEPAQFNAGGRVQPESVSGVYATAGFLRALGLKPVLGRNFTADEERPGAPHVVLIGYKYWQRRFDGDPRIVGREITIDLEPATIIGVLPRIGRSYYASYAIWTPLVAEARRLSREARTLQVAALLRPGVSFAQAAAQLRPSDKGWSAAIVPMAQMAKHVLPMYVILLTIVGLLLLIVCANVATLQLARAAGRQAEIALRMALGASRIRIISQLLTEGFVIAGISGALGFVLTAAARRILVASVPELADIRIDGWVLAFTALVSLAAGVFFGLSPALSASRPDLNGMLKTGSKTMAAATGRRIRGVLVVAEMTVAVMLLTGLGLLVRAFLSMHQANIGFSSRNLVAINVALPAKKYPTAGQSAAFYRLAVERLASVPGVEAVGAASAAPLSAAGSTLKIETDSRAVAESIQAQYNAATPEYFGAAGIPVLRGRGFTAADRAPAPAVAIVNERAAALLWPGQDATDQRVRIDTGEWRTVIGVVADAQQNLFQPAAPEFYVPHAQDARNAMCLIVRTKADPSQSITMLRKEARTLDPDLQIAAVNTIDEIIDGYFPAAIVAGAGAFCLAALFLAALGLYGVVSYVAAQRTHEFGVRMAIGARSADLAGLVLHQGLKMAATGTLLGLVAGAGIGRILANIITGVKAADPLVFVAVAAVLCAVTLLASYVPALRATRVSPIVALRYE
jgi:putative ABC transport system permease protein